MIEPLVLVLALMTSGSAPVPIPSTSAAPAETLREIGHVTVSGPCTAIVMRANSAISATLRNDQTMTMTINSLKKSDFDSKNQIDKQRAMREIDRLAADLRNASGNAETQIKILRDIAEKTDDPVRKAELKAFADALGGALFHQKRVGSDLQRMLVIMEGRDARNEARADMVQTLPDMNVRVAGPALMSMTDMHDSFDNQHFNQMAQSAAKDVELRALSIQADESKAAEHVIGSVNGC